MIIPAPCKTGNTDLPASSSNAACATFARVSVVRIACANCENASVSAASASRTAGNAATSFSAGSGTPIIPVEEGKTSCPSQPNVWDAARHTCSHAAIPIAPVAQFALPAFTATTRTRPPLRARCLRPTVIGAACTRLDVNIAAALAPGFRCQLRQP